MTGHIHRQLMQQYTSIAVTASDPWNYFETLHIFEGGGVWVPLQEGQFFKESCAYRRKPKLKLIHGVEVPDITFEPEEGQDYITPDIHGEEYASGYVFHKDVEHCEMAKQHNLCYPRTKEGQDAAILHARAMLKGDRQ